MSYGMSIVYGLTACLDT